MKRIYVVSLAMFYLLIGFGPSHAADDCNYAWMLANTDGSKATQEQVNEKEQREAECRQRLADQGRDADQARKRLAAEFGVNSAGMTDQEVIARLNNEIDERHRAEEDAADVRAEQEEQDRVEAQEQLLAKQNKMLKGLGISMGNDDDENADENIAEYDDVDPIELQMYLRMVDSGVAPECKGRTGMALIDCVDAVLDAEE